MTDRKRDLRAGPGLSRRALISAGAGGAAAIGLSAQAAAERPAPTSGPRFNAKTFGATGDGRTNDTAALRRAIAAAVRAGGGQVYLPQGTYRTNDLHVGRNGNGRQPTVRNVHIVGEGIGVTVLRHNAGAGEYGAITLIDAAQCSVRELTIDSSRIRGRGTNGGLLLFGCQDCLLENVEVRHSNYRTISVAGTLFEFGRLPARNTIVRGCIGRGQRLWDGNAAAMLIASDEASATTFVDCVAYAERFEGDLFGADDASATVFRGCRAYGDGAASAGFWIEHDKGERPAFFTDCYVENAVNVGIGGIEGAERMQLQNCHLYRVAKNAIWGGGTGRLFVDGCIVEECGKTLPKPQGTIQMHGGGSISNTRITNGRIKSPAISIYNDGHGTTSALVHIDGCVTDGDISVLRRAALTVNITGTTFLERAKLVVDRATTTTVSVNSCLFMNEGVEVAGADNVVLSGNVFRARRGFRGAAITGKAKAKNPISVSNNSFFDYKTVRSGSLDLHATANRFVRCGETLEDAGAGGATSTHRLRVQAGRPTVIPGVGKPGIYFVLVAGASPGGPKDAFMVSVPTASGASKSLLGDRTGDSAGDGLDLVSVRGRPALRSARAADLRLTVIAAAG